MPDVNIKITREGATAKQKSASSRVTDGIVKVLNKDPNEFCKVSMKLPWKIWALAACCRRIPQGESRQGQQERLVSRRSVELQRCVDQPVDGDGELRGGLVGAVQGSEGSRVGAGVTAGRDADGEIDDVVITNSASTSAPIAGAARPAIR